MISFQEASKRSIHSINRSILMDHALAFLAFIFFTNRFETFMLFLKTINNLSRNCKTTRRIEVYQVSLSQVYEHFRRSIKRFKLWSLNLNQFQLPLCNLGILKDMRKPKIKNFACRNMKFFPDNDIAIVVTCLHAP